jgi:hypothetical protein
MENLIVILLLSLINKLIEGIVDAAADRMRQ